MDPLISLSLRDDRVHALFNPITDDTWLNSIEKTTHNRNMDTHSREDTGKHAKHQAHAVCKCQCVRHWR